MGIIASMALMATSKSNGHDKMSHIKHFFWIANLFTIEQISEMNFERPEGAEEIDLLGLSLEGGGDIWHDMLIRLVHRCCCHMVRCYRNRES